MLEVKKDLNPFREYANATADTTNKNKTSEIIINGVNTNMPNNVPVCVIGEKGSGKTTLLKSIIELTHKANIYKHYFVIYSTVNLDEEMPDYAVMIPVDDAEQFIASLFEIKSIFNSYYRFFKSNSKKNLKTIKTDELDNNIKRYNREIINSDMPEDVKIERIISTGDKIIRGFSQSFKLGDVVVKEGIHPEDLDMIIIDDLAIAAPIIFKDIKHSPLYEYFTLTRHMRLSIILAGQQIDQLPAALRREIQCWLFSKDTQSFHLLKNILSREVVKAIEAKQAQLEKKYEFVIYNRVNGVISIL